MVEIMSKVKLETNYVCRGCLSQRKLSTFKDYDGLFTYLLNSQIIVQCNDAIDLCWECIALIRNIRRFQLRIQKADAMLQQSLCELDTTSFSSLSELSCKQINSLELTVNYEDGECRIEKSQQPTSITDDQPSQIHVKLADTVKQEKLELDVQIKENYLEFNEDTTHFDSSTTYYDTQEPTVKKIKPKLLKDSKKTFRKYANKAKITINTEIDLSNISNYYNLVYKTEKEMQAMLERESKRRDYKKLRYSCKECKMGFSMAVNFKRHNTFKHMTQTHGSLKCLECGTVCASRADLLSHWDQHRAALRCAICGAEHLAPGKMRRHVATHQHLYTCTLCRKHFWSLKDFGEHYRSLHKKLICDHCGQTFIHKHAIQKHMRRHHMAALCRECGRQYKSYHALETHYRMIHPQLVYKTVKSESSYCVECNKQYPSVYKYKRHLATAAVHKPPKKIRVSCPECGKVFARKTYMNNHYKLVHMKRSNHYCHLCDKYFTSAHSAKKHKQCIHDKIQEPKNKICDVCGKAFTTNRILVHHMRTHTGERPYRCAACPATFAQLAALRSHARARHGHAAH